MQGSVDPPQQEMQTLIGLLNQGKFEEVLRRTSVLAQRYSRSVVLCNIAGAANGGLLRSAAALASFDKAIQLKPDYADAYNDLGLTLRAAGNVDGAVADFEQALRIRPRFAETRVNLGNIFGERKQWKEAVSQFEEALRDDPRRAEAQYGLGTTLLLAGRAAEAVAPLQEALRCRPNYPEARQNLDLALNAAAGEVR